MSSTITIVFYVIDVILICVGITFKILTKRRMRGIQKSEDKKVDLKDFTLLENLDSLCFECPNIFIYSEKKKKVRYYCKRFNECLNSSVDDLKEVKGDE